MSELLLYGLVAMGAGVLLLQLVLLQRSGRKDDSLEPGFSALQSGLERVERELRQEMARARQESATAARGDREEQAQSLDRLAKTLMERHISVSTAEPFCVTANVPQAIRIALGSVPFDSLRAALVQVREAVEFEQYR